MEPLGVYREKVELVIQINFANPRIPGWVDLAGGFQNWLEAEIALSTYFQVVGPSRHTIRVIQRTTRVWEEHAVLPEAPHPDDMLRDYLNDNS